jgi:3-oxoacyl-[acyl-carrier-protein] synthase-3
MVKNGRLAPHSIEKGDVVIFASVGAGMNINAIIYRY